MGGPLLREMPRALPSVKHLPAVSFPFLWEHKKSVQLVFLSDTSQGRKQVCPTSGGLGWAELPKSDLWQLQRCTPVCPHLPAPPHTFLNLHRGHARWEGSRKWIISLEVIWNGTFSEAFSGPPTGLPVSCITFWVFRKGLGWLHLGWDGAGV